MADYEIVARIVAEDHTGGALASAGRRVNLFERNSLGAANRIMGAFTRAFAVIGGAAGIGILSRGLVGIHTEIESAEAGITTLISAVTGAPIASAMQDARGVIALLRKDAAVGAGELQDYTQGFQNIFAPAAQAGASIDQIRELTRGAVTTGFALRGQEGSRLAGLDVQQALTAGLGDRTTPFALAAVRSIGMTKEAFNDLNRAARVTALVEAFGNFTKSAEVMGQTWDAQSATFRDQIKELLRTVSAPIFNRWKDGLASVNQWLARNQERLEVMANRWGQRLVEIWDTLIARAGTYAGILAGLAVAQAVVPAGQAVAARGGIAASLGLASAPGLGGGIGAALSGLGAALLRVAGPIAFVTTLIAGIGGAFQEFQGLAALVGQSLAFLLDSFVVLGQSLGLLTAEGSVLNQVGLVLVLAFVGLVEIIGVVVRGVSLLISALSIMGRTIGEMVRGIFSRDFSAFDSKNIVTATEEAGRVMQRAFQLGPEAGGIAERIEGALTGSTGDGSKPVVGPGDINLNGPVTIVAKTEINEDPGRVATVIGDVLEDLNRFRRTARRGATLTLG